MDFICIDFETANEKRASVCSVALIYFIDNEIVDVKEWLIKPPKDYRVFNPFNIQIHGITPDIVEECLEFNEVWPEIRESINGKVVVAHNAPFDIGVLMSLIDYYNLEYCNIEFLCTCNVARKTWDNQVNYTLKNIANMLCYIFNHHDAHDDAKTCGKILIDACNFHQVNTIEELLLKIDMQIGLLSSETYRPCSISKAYKGLGGKNNEVRVKEIAATTENFDTDHCLYGKKIIFTGTLVGMTRRNAMQSVVNVGGFIGDGVTKDTNFLVMGLQDYSRLSDGKESSKTKKAKELIRQGYAIEIIGEDEFLRML